MEKNNFYPEQNRQTKESLLTELTSPAMIAYIKGAIRKVNRNIERADIDDITQDVLMQASKAIQKDAFQQKSSLTTWVTRIAFNATFSFFKARKRHPIIDTNGSSYRDLPSPLPDPEQLALNQEETKLFLSRIEDLPEKQKAILRLKIQGRSDKEIADQLKIADVTVRTTIHQAKKVLKQNPDE